MTSATLQISRLIYLGPNKPPAGDVDLKPGLNIICGSSETGKSFVVETIDFMLGGVIRADATCPSARDMTVLSCRSPLAMGENVHSAVSSRAGDIFGAQAIMTSSKSTDETLKPSHDSEKEDNLSRRVLDHSRV